MMTPSISMASPFTLVSKIGAYKSFSEILPLKFANFTCNQALLEAMGGYDLIHIIDFEIGYGGQWASLTQELALGSGGAPSPIITAFSSTSVHDQIELGLTRENLSHFAREINMPFKFEIVGIDAISRGHFCFIPQILRQPRIIFPLVPTLTTKCPSFRFYAS